MNSSKLIAFLVLGVFVFASVSVAVAADVDGDSNTAEPKAIEDKIPDYCYAAVDPFKIGDQRKKFFKAAGKDRELSRAEFDASQKLTASKKSDPKAGGFARVFDRWQTLTEYDRDKDSTISWVETEPYRRAFRRVVLNKFDANRDGRLKGPERQKANEAIHSGKLFAVPKKAAVKVKSSSADAETGESAEAENEAAAKAKSAGDKAAEKSGKENSGTKIAHNEEDLATVRKEMAEREVNHIYEKYDINGDGQLDADEREKMLSQRGEEIKSFLLGMYDEDGDGKLDPKEKSRSVVFGQWANSHDRYAETYFYDLDGNGQVSREERMQITQEMMVEWPKIQDIIKEYGDTDGDGKISNEENRALGKRAQNMMKTMADSRHDEYDVDGDGLLNENEKADMYKGIEYEMDDQFTYYDADANGVLSSEERSDYFRGLIIMIFEAE